jgi:hypothetical protein
MFSGYMQIIYTLYKQLENSWIFMSMEYPGTSLQSISREDCTFSKFSQYKINMQESIAFLHSDIEKV